MSEAQPRSSGPRGRGSFRGGRGGYRGGRGGKTHRNEDQENIPPQPVEDEGEVGELKRRFGSKVSTLRELFPEWSDEDLVYALKETDGDLESTIDRMSSGSISQWQENKKKHPKPKEAHAKDPEPTHATRGGRGRGGVEGRGRGRGTERGRAGRGGRAGAQTNGTRAAERTAKVANDGWDSTSAPPTEAVGNWDAPTNGETAAAGDWATETSNQAAATAPGTITEQKSDIIPAGKVSGWNKLFEKPKPAPAPKQVPQVSSAPAPESTVAEATTASEGLPAPQVDSSSSANVDEAVNAAPEVPPPDPAITLTPSKDELTETNLERLPDISNPPATVTAASTAASTQDPRNSSGSNIPALRPGMSGYATSALKATTSAGRSASFNRRVMEQHEAVVMPGNHAVDRAAVQFGSMGLNGSAEDLDVDEDREEPETRTQLPDDSPVAPRASLPPPSVQAQPQPEADSSQAIRQAPGLPPLQQQAASSPSQANTYANQFAGYGQAPQKAYDPFGQPQVQQPQQQQPQSQVQEPFSGQATSQPQPVSSSAPTEYSSFYGNNQQRDLATNNYQNYYGGYGQGQEAQPRSGSAFGTSAQDVQPQYATARPQQGHGQQDAQNSGSNTPNPVAPGHQNQQSQQMHQGHGSYGGYSYGYPNAYGQQYGQYGGSYMNQMGASQHRYGQHRPMYDDVRRQTDDYHMPQNSQYGYGHNQQYAGQPYNKSSMYGQPQHQYSYEQSASPANTGGYGQASMAGREAAYGRTGSAQLVESQQAATNSVFGGINDAFGRTHTAYGAQAQPMSQQHSAQQAAGADTGKEYDSQKLGGPSPSMAQANRPGSATNMTGQQQAGQAGGYPPSQHQQAGQNAFASYPQYGGSGAFGGTHQGQASHQQTGGYGSYGAAGGFGSYGGYGGGRGWNNQYAGH